MTKNKRESRVDINVKAFRWNFNKIKERVAPAKIAAVVKADAYGHGAEVLAREAEKLGAEYLCVAFPVTGIKLKKAGINTKILVLTKPSAEDAEIAIENDLELIVDGPETAKMISEAAGRSGKQAVVHIYIDTGMHCAGIPFDNANESIEKIREIENIYIKGIFTHFAASDWSDLQFTYLQIERFKKVLDEIRFYIPVVHAANTGGILQVPESYFDMVRPGLGLYGYYPSMLCKRSILLKPVLSYRSTVSAIKEYVEGVRFGYSLTYTANNDTKIATVLAGYADGVNRLLSNNGSVLIKGKEYPVVGRVAMDAILVDIGLDSGVEAGDEVVLIGKQGKNEITIYDWCERLSTIPYEITCNISQRIPRIYKNYK